MKIFKAVVVRIDEVPSENGGFSQKEIIVVPYSNERELATEYIAIPPSIFPTDAFGSGIVSLPEINQHCLVVETDGYRRVQILTYIPYSTTTLYGEYTPVDVTSGGAAFKIGGVKPLIMYFHKGGKFELFSNEFCKFYFDGSRKAIGWTVDTEERIFAGGRVLNTLEEIDGIEKLTRHLEVYSRSFEWKQNSDIRLPAERSVLNPSSSIIPTADYTYTPKVLIKAGTIKNEFDSDLGTIAGHLYEIETRQAVYSGDKDVVSKLKLGRQSEFYKYDNNKIYPGGDLYEWTSKTAKITGDASQVSTYLFRFGELEKDVIENGVSVETVRGEVFRNQIYINILDTSGTPVTDNLAEGQGYEFSDFKAGAEQQYLISYGRLTSEILNGNANNYYRSAVREHFHVFDNHSVVNISTPTGFKKDAVLFFENNGELGLYSEKCVRLVNGEEKVFEEKVLTDQSYRFIQNINSIQRNLFFDLQKFENVVKFSENFLMSEILKNNLYENVLILDGTTNSKETLTAQEYKEEVTLGNKVFKIIFNSSGEIKIELSNEQNSPSITLNGDGIFITPGSLGEKIFLGEGEGLQSLVTKQWVETIFKNHIHPTTGIGTPTAPPIPLPEIPVIINSPVNIFTYKIKGE